MDTMIAISNTPSNHKPTNHTILLVDDDKRLRNFMHTLLAHHGFNVIEANDGVEAVCKFTEYMNSIALVLLDVTMPHKDGVTAYNEIKDLNPNAVVLFMSGFSETALHKISNVNFIKKPMMSADLLQKIRELIGTDCQTMAPKTEDERDYRDVSYTHVDPFINQTRYCRNDGH